MINEEAGTSATAEINDIPTTSPGFNIYIIHIYFRQKTFKEHLFCKILNFINHKNCILNFGIASKISFQAYAIF